MPDPPPRRWFQFQLSTWFVLVGLLAWAMLEWPWVVTLVNNRVQNTTDEWSSFPADPSELPEPALNPDLRYPALALAAFVGWKAAGVVARRVARRSTRVGEPT